jgi:hypothetical protein
MHSKRILSFVILTFVSALSAVTCAAGKPAINTSRGGLALGGYDAVAYWSEGKPAQGSSSFEYRWMNTVWRFASAEHRDQFMKEPERYAPQFGGYCAYAVSQGTTADIDPESWTIFEGRLYLNLNKDVQRLWEKNMREYIRKADENWPRILKKQK